MINFLRNLFGYKKLEEGINAFERMVRDIFNLLDKEGCTMILWEKECSWSENWAKITDRKHNVTFEILGRNIIPPLEGVRTAIKMLKSARKKK